jgi:hypothetical protein
MYACGDCFSIITYIFILEMLRKDACFFNWKFQINLILALVSQTEDASIYAFETLYEGLRNNSLLEFLSADYKILVGEVRTIEISRIDIRLDAPVVVAMVW